MALPFIPPRAIGGYDPGPAWAENLTMWGLGLMVVGAVAAVCGRALHKIALPRVDVSARPGATVAVLAAMCGALSLWFQLWPFGRGTYLIDEMAQLFHANVLASGVLAGLPPVPASAFLLPHTWISGAGWISQYPPGHLLLLALGGVVELEWIVNPLLYTGSAVLVFVLGRSLYGRAVGIGAALLWTLSSWVALTASSYMNHMSAVAVALVAWVAVFGVRNVSNRRIVIAGAALAFVAAIRPLDAIAATVPIGLWILHNRRWRSIGLLVTGAVPVGALWAWFNFGTVGEPFTLGYSLLYGSEHALGFHIDPWGRSYTPAVAVANLIAGIRRLHIYAFAWPVPGLLLLGVWALIGKKRRFADLVTAAGIIAAPVLYLLYWHSGFFRGPRFYLLAAPFLYIAMARGWAVIHRWLAFKSPGWIRLDRGFVGASVLVVLWGSVGLLPNLLRQHAAAFPVLKERPREQLKAAGVDSAVVLVRTSWGNRVVADLWALGVKPGLAERAYRRLDTCDLDALRRVGSVWADSELSQLLTAMLDRAGAEVPAVRGWPDPTVRLRDAQTADPRCAEEMRRDLEGFTVAEHLIAANDPTLRGGIVFARDLWERNEEILRRYPGWAVWSYRPPDGMPTELPQLELLRPGGE